MADNSGGRSMKGQRIHPFLPFDRVNVNHGGLAAKFNRGDDRIDFGRIEIALELRARFPFFHEEQRLGFVEVGVEMGSHAPCGCPRGAK